MEQGYPDFNGAEPKIGPTRERKTAFVSKSRGLIDNELKTL
jgi:hypothetical protein